MQIMIKIMMIMNVVSFCFVIGPLQFPPVDFLAVLIDIACVQSVHTEPNDKVSIVASLS